MQSSEGAPKKLRVSNDISPSSENKTSIRKAQDGFP